MADASSLWTLEGLGLDDDDAVMEGDGDDGLTSTEWLQRHEDELAAAEAAAAAESAYKPLDPAYMLTESSQHPIDDDVEGEWEEIKANVERFKGVKIEMTELARQAGEKKSIIQKLVNDFNQNNPTKYVNELREKISKMPADSNEEILAKAASVQNFNTMYEVCEVSQSVSQS